MSALPFAKLGALTIRTLSKPVANTFKQYAVRHPRFTSVCIFTGELNNKVSYYFNKLIRDKSYVYKPQDTKISINKGADILGEILLYTIAAVLLTEEYIRSSKASKKKEQELYDRLDKIENDISKLK